MISLTLPLVTGFLLAGQPASSLPDVARNLPSTWPPPGWGTRVVMAGERGETAVPAKPVAAPAVEQDKWVDVFPHVRINRAQKAVEFDGTVPWDFHDPDSPRTELELLVCLPLRDKEHESLVMSQATGAHVHAALLMVGFEPGTPGHVEFGEGKDDKLTRFAPIGPAVKVTFRYSKEGKEQIADPRDWFEDEIGEREWKDFKAQRAQRGDSISTGRPFNDESERYPLTLVFGGSKVGPMRDENGNKTDVYFADMSGALVGLCTFGNETIGNRSVVSPDSGVDVPRFVARNDAIPAMNTPVRVRVEPEPPSQFRGSPTSATMPAGSNKKRVQTEPAAPQPRP